MPSAVGLRDGRESFGGDTLLDGRLGEGPEWVRISTVRHLIEVDGLPTPDLLKIDAPDMVLFIAIHSAALYEECRALLQVRGFRLFDSRPLAEQRNHPSRPWLGDPDLLAVGAIRDLTDDDIHSLPFFAG